MRTLIYKPLLLTLLFFFIALESYAQYCTGCTSTTNLAPDPNFTNTCNSSRTWQSSLDICDSTQSSVYGFAYLVDVSSLIYPSSNSEDMTYGQGTNMLTGKVFSNENEVLVWGIDSIYAAEDLKLCIGAEIISISQNFDERFWAIYRILDSNDSILSSDTFYIATSSEKYSINSIWQSTSNQYVKAALYILTRESNPAWFSLDNISIKELTNLNPSPLSLKSILLDSTQSEFEITISNSLGFSSISIANELDGNIYSGTDSVISIPAYSHSGYNFIGIHSSGCEVTSSYSLSKPDSGAEYYASRIGIGTGSPVTHRQPWIREGCGLEYTINSVSTRTIGIHPNMSNCSPLNNPINPISINFTIPDTCVRLEEVRIYWYEYSDQDTLLHINASYPDTFTITNNTTSAQATITSGVLRGQLLSHFIVQGQT
jgi:hypothetical protein